MATTPNNPLASGDTAYLYRAAIGPRGQDYYLRHFTRFDAEGKAGTSWNWAAYWSTFNWLVYRKMGARALAYLGTLIGLALLVFGLGKVVLDYSDATAILLGLLLLTGAFVVPGLYGNAWFYAHCNRRITATLRNTKDVKEAAAQLSQAAPGPKRLLMQGVLNAAVVALAFGVVQWLQSTEGNLADLAPPNTPMMADSAANQHKASGRVTETAAGAVTEAPAASAATTPATTPPSAPPADTVASNPVATSLEPNTAAAATSSARATEPTMVAAADKAPAKVNKAEPAPAAPAESAPPPAKPAKPVKPVTPAAPATVTPPSTADADTSPAAANPSATPPAAKPRVRYVWVIQVGAYVQEENARRTLAQVQSLGLEAGTDSFSTAQGTLMRVRVGPFSKQAEAEQAALRIKSLDLPALLLRQRP